MFNLYIFLELFQQNRVVTSVIMTYYARLSYIKGCRNFRNMNFNMAFTLMYTASYILAVDKLSMWIPLIRYLRLAVVPSEIRLALLL